MSKEIQLTYSSKNTYSTLNELTNHTETIWMAFHGMGYLSRYFIKYFKDLDADKNFIIAPQAPSKYYLDNTYKHVGASWLTRENTSQETENVLSYVDAVWAKEKPKQFKRLIVMGYSQGVSIATRWLASRQIKCDKLLLHSGGIPNELEKGQFDFLEGSTRVIFLYGKHDPYINVERIKLESTKARMLFNDKVEIVEFDGKHEVYTDYLATL
ncbi:MAG: esterase [Flavobacteriaceae bacterium]|nr:esterase [Flavobacteriaceae bacterium]